MTTSLLKTLEAGITRLANLSPDGVAYRNDVGFNGRDVQMGLSLANQVGDWTEAQARIAHKICWTYHKTQLSDLDIPSVLPESFVQEVAEARREKDEEVAESAGPEFGLIWGKAREVKTTRGPRITYSAPCTQAFWAAWRTRKDEIKARGWTVGQWQGEWQVTKWVVPANTTINQHVEAPYVLLPLRDPSGLLAWQPEKAAQLAASVRAHAAAIDASDTGTGKTYQALAAVRELGQKAIIVAPLVTHPGWRRAADLLNVEILTVIGWEKVRTGNTDWCKWDDELGRYNWVLPTDAVLIFDEAHRAKSPKTKNAKLVMAAKRQGVPAIAMSATLVEDPLDMRAVGYLLGLHDGTSKWWGWTQRYGCRPGRWGGFVFSGDHSHLERLHKEIFPRKGARTRIADLGDAFPANDVQTQIVDLGEVARREISEIYAEMESQLADLAAKQREDGDALPITIRLRARQKIELLKVPGFAELAKDTIDSGRSCVLFFNFNESIAAAAEALKDYSPAIIQGGQSDEGREAEVQRFQSNSTRLILVNVAAGGLGVSLHDLDGRFPRSSFISPNDDARMVIQALGRINRAGGKSPAIQRIVGVEGTVEVSVLDNYLEKLGQITTMNDGTTSEA